MSAAEPESKLIGVSLYDRDRFSRGHSRKVFGYEAYHWAIIIMPETGRGRKSRVFDATDKAEMDPVTFRLDNPTMDWWFREKNDVDPDLSVKLLGRLVIGKVPSGVSGDEISELFEAVPLPVKNTHPQQSCVTWVVDAIRAMQEKGWVAAFDLDKFKDAALAYADSRLPRTADTPEVKDYLSSA
ncbi:hypothetical protein K4F52_005390 [Lecanicillium sp. MT-2017a]|nr:hypothetical protein K4F52_005390 [Lecanicillium sp. MT-2017a]